MPADNGKRDTQRTKTGYEIPVPERKDVFGLLGRASKKTGESSRSARRKRRTSRDPQ
jgi:hypothetical protein